MTSAFWRECDWRCDCGNTRWNWYFINKVIPVRSCSPLSPSRLWLTKTCDSQNQPLKLPPCSWLEKKYNLPPSISKSGLEFNWLPEDPGFLMSIVGPGCPHTWWATSAPAFSSILHNNLLYFTLLFPVGLESCRNPKWILFKPATLPVGALQWTQWWPKPCCYCPCMEATLCPLDSCAGPTLATAWSHGNNSPWILKSGIVFLLSVKPAKLCKLIYPSLSHLICEMEIK